MPHARGGAEEPTDLFNVKTKLPSSQPARLSNQQLISSGLGADTVLSDLSCPAYASQRPTMTSFYGWSVKT